MKNTTFHAEPRNISNNTNVLNDTSSSLLSAADINDTLLTNFINYINVIKQVNQSNTSDTIRNDYLLKRLTNYLDSAKLSNYSDNPDTNQLEKLLKNLTNDRDLLNFTNHAFINHVNVPDVKNAMFFNHLQFFDWRDQSFAHPCMKDMMNIREVNECFRKFAEKEMTSRNAISSTNSTVKPEGRNDFGNGKSEITKNETRGQQASILNGTVVNGTITSRRYNESCDDSIKGNLRCDIKTHVSSDNFAGNITKIDSATNNTMNNGSISSAIYNETTDFDRKKDSFTMKNITTMRNCEGCLRNATGDGKHFLQYENQNKSFLVNISDEANVNRNISKRDKIYRVIQKFPVEALLETASSREDSEMPVYSKGFEVNKRRLISNHVMNRNTKTSSNGTVTQKTTEGKSLTDDDGKPVDDKNKDNKAGEQQTANQNHYKILNDILNDVHDKPVSVNPNERKEESIENRTIPIDPSMLPKKEPVLTEDNMDADVGILGIDTRPPIEPKINKTKTKDLNSTAVKNKSSSLQNKDLTNSSATGNITASNDTDSKPKMKRILCFGDSLTKGYHDGGKKYHPYSMKLEELIKDTNMFPVEVYNHGVNGECVSVDMKKRLQEDLEELPKLDLVIILGGTNDLLQENCAKDLDLFDEIKDLHEMVRKKDYKSVIVTIPEAKVSSNGTEKMTLTEYRSVLDDVNQKLRMYAVAAKLPICDLADEFPRHSLPGKTNMTAMWDDEIHPSKEGYDRIGDIIYEDLKDILK